MLSRGNKLRSVAELTLEMNNTSRRSEADFRKGAYRKAANQRTKEQIAYEMEFLQKNRTCTPSQNEALAILEGMDVNTITNKLTREFYDVNVQEAFRCIVDNVVSDDRGDEKMMERTHEFFSDPKRFGSESVNGFAMKTSVGNVNNHFKKKVGMMVLKCPRDPFKSFEMVHEVSVGLAGLNTVREDCPHFSYVYDSFKCGGPVSDSQKNIVQWCLPGSPPVSYAVYESVNNPTPIEDLTDPEEVVLMYTQSMIGSKYAYDRTKFVHLDAHGQNVLASEYSKNPFHIKYSNYNGKTVFVKSKGKIPMYIDYGMSRIQTPDGRSIGILDPDGFFASCGISPDYDHVIGDAYKLVCMIMIHAMDKRRMAVVDVCRKILGYFFGVPEITPEEVEIIIKKQWNDRFHIVSELINPAWDINKLITHCMKIALTFDKEAIIVSDPKNAHRVEPKLVLGKNVVHMDDEVPVISQGRENMDDLDHLVEMSSISVDVPTAYDLFTAVGTPEYPKILKRMTSNPHASVEKEKHRLAKYESYTFKEDLFAVPSDYNFILRNKGILAESIEHVAEAVQVLFELTRNVEYLEYVSGIISDFRPLLDLMRDKRAELIMKLQQKKALVTSGMKRLMEHLYGFHDRKPSPAEVERATERPLYTLATTYMDVYESLVKAL